MRNGRAIVWALAAALAACGQSSQPETAPAQTAQRTFEPAGSPAEIAPSDADAQYLQAAASVYQVIPLRADGAKLFTTVGGDPAINGVYTYVAVFQSVMDGWRVFQIGDFNEVKLLADEGDRFVLEVSRSQIDDAGDIQTATERLIVTTPTSDSGAITVTPAK